MGEIKMKYEIIKGMPKGALDYQDIFKKLESLPRLHGIRLTPEITGVQTREDAIKVRKRLHSQRAHYKKQGLFQIRVDGLNVLLLKAR